MLPRFLTLMTAGLFATVAAIPAPAQEAGQNGIEVLARGPVHEAYATTAEFPTPGPVVPKAPPPVIEELPPDQKPEGDSVQWMPGYWHWDDERNDFVWISGFWRVPPPGRVWMPGSWREGQGGHQWTQGFWLTANQAGAAPQADVQYLPAPPQPIEAGPPVPSPAASSFYVPGCWVWRERYVWRPGFWLDARPGWVWVPAHYRWTPIGYVFVDGYWDYPLENRGVLFAPVAFAQPIYTRPAFAYTPTYCVSYQSLCTAMFVRRGCGSYFFGDYFGVQYVRGGYNPWAGSVAGTSFSLNIGFGRGGFYDPMWGYYSALNRGNPGWANGIGNFYSGRYAGSIPRPPRTLVQQTQLVNNITNNTVNVTNVNVNKTSVINNTTVVAPVANIRQANPNVRMQQIQREDRVREQQLANQVQQAAFQRRQQEANIAARNPTASGAGRPTVPNVGRAAGNPVQVKLNVPQQAVARSQAIPRGFGNDPPAVPTESRRQQMPAVQPRPNPPAAANPRPAAPTPQPNRTLPATPRVEPKVQQPTPRQQPRPNPAPNQQRTQPVNPAPRPNGVQPQVPRGFVQPSAPTQPAITPRLAPPVRTPVRDATPRAQPPRPQPAPRPTPNPLPNRAAPAVPPNAKLSAPTPPVARGTMPPASNRPTQMGRPSPLPASKGGKPAQPPRNGPRSGVPAGF